MIDMHYDILSVIYQCYLRDDFQYIEEWIKNYNKDNVKGVIANLYFMNREEMKKEIGDDAYAIDVVSMFRVATDIFKKYLPDTKVIFSIEGCDYIKDVFELEQLYELGLRNILLVWNNPNKYGSGNRGDYGLTDLGREFLIRAVDLGICIDLSHMNKKTFYDTVELLKEQRRLGKKIKVIASHSNCYDLYSHERNLDDEQILSLKELDSIIGVVSYSKFVAKDSCVDFKKAYLEHIKHMVSLVGISNVGVSTDDMEFSLALFNDDSGKKIFDYKTVAFELRGLLGTYYSKEEIDKILYKNVEEKIFR